MATWSELSRFTFGELEIFSFEQLADLTIEEIASRLEEHIRRVQSAPQHKLSMDTILGIVSLVLSVLMWLKDQQPDPQQELVLDKLTQIQEILEQQYSLEQQGQETQEFILHALQTIDDFSNAPGNGAESDPQDQQEQ